VSHEKDLGVCMGVEWFDLEQASYWAVFEREQTVWISKKIIPGDKKPSNKKMLISHSCTTSPCMATLPRSGLLKQSSWKSAASCDEVYP
jgi:hypothetical protein